MVNDNSLPATAGKPPRLTTRSREIMTEYGGNLVYGVGHIQ